MNPALNKMLHIAAAVWIVLGMACYCYGFTRDFYKSNTHSIQSMLDKAGL